MKTILILAAAAMLSGCDTLSRQFDNIAACSVARDQAIIVSMWGPLGVASKVRQQDAAIMCAAAPAPTR